jgi:hypothetical protein
VRGLEYCTLSVLVRELREIRRTREWPAGAEAGQERIRTLAMEFAAKARELLVRERFALQRSHITYERCDDPQVQVLRDMLFSRSKSHGGLFKVLVDEIDRLLYLLMASDEMDVSVYSADSDSHTGDERILPSHPKANDDRQTVFEQKQHLPDCRKKRMGGESFPAVLLERCRTIDLAHGHRRDTAFREKQDIPRKKNAKKWS